MSATAVRTNGHSKIDVQAVKAGVDLLALIGQGTTLTKRAATMGGEYAGPCPFCGGDDRLRVQPLAPDGGRWWCRSCSPDEHWQDAIAYVRQRDGVDFLEAVHRLSGAAPSPPPHRSAQPSPPKPGSPGERPWWVDAAPVARWPYVDPATGAVVAYHERRERSHPKKPGELEKAYPWTHPDGRLSRRGEIAPAALPLYGARLLRAHPAAIAVPVEGEKAADAFNTAAEREGLADQAVAVSFAGGAAQTDFGPALDDVRGRPLVAPWPDYDAPGAALMARLGRALAGERVVPVPARLLFPGEPPAGQDAWEWCERDGMPVADVLELLRDRAAVAEREPPPRTSSSSSSPKGNDDDDVLGTEADPQAAPEPAPGPAERLARATGTLGALRRRYSAAVEYLAAPYIALSQVTFVVGAQESLKSWAMADLGRAVHTGGLWLGAMRVRRGKVLYFEQERAKNLVYQTALLEEGWGVDLSGITAVEPCGLDLCHPEWQAAVIAQVERERPVLVVFNSYRAIFKGRAPDSSDVANALGWLGALCERVNCAVCLVDGTNKGGSVGRLRGTEAHGDSVQKAFEADTILHVERKRNELGRGTGPAKVFLGKQRYGAGDPPAPFVFDAVAVAGGGVRVLWLDETAEDRDTPDRIQPAAARVYDALKVAPADAATIADVATAAGLTTGSAKNALTQLRADGRAWRVARGRWCKGPQPSSSSSSGLGDDDDDDDAGGGE